MLTVIGAAHGAGRDIMARISEVERPGLALRLAYRIGARMFGVVPTTEKVMAHRPALMAALGGLYTALEHGGLIEAPLRALLNLHVARVYGSPY
jgi:hypothetical protein